MSKYKPLSDRLSAHGAPEWRASFAEIEEVLGFPLPRTARSGQSWWGDEKRAWRDHGWRADDIDHEGGYVTFKRDGQTTAAVAESVVMPETGRTEDVAMHGATAPPMPPGRRGRTGPIVAGVAVAAGVAAFLARRMMRRRAA
jgi:hypothetical protein